MSALTNAANWGTTWTIDGRGPGFQSGTFPAEAAIPLLEECGKLHEKEDLKALRGVQTKLNALYQTVRQTTPQDLRTLISTQDKVSQYCENLECDKLYSSRNWQGLRFVEVRLTNLINSGKIRDPDRLIVLTQRLNCVRNYRAHDPQRGVALEGIEAAQAQEDVPHVLGARLDSRLNDVQDDALNARLDTMPHFRNPAQIVRKVLFVVGIMLGCVGGFLALAGVGAFGIAMTLKTASTLALIGFALFVIAVGILMLTFIPYLNRNMS